ncbi:MAG: sugar-transfer associated ATP-grasp domain-containing protein, partial [Pseudomonadales bacterium]
SVILGPVPDFSGALKTVNCLHQEMSDIKTIAWDLCLTEAGWTVLEGNTGWGLVRPQSLSGIPLLNSGLQGCY